MVVRLAVLLAALALAYLSVVVTLANAAAAQLPPFALRLWPAHASAHARLADQMLAADPANPPIAEMSAHALSALRRNPTIAAAARVLALRAAMQRDDSRAGTLFDYAAAMSKRDIPTQLWLLERRVTQDDVDGALAHFGIALRVSPATREMLFPVLSSALAEAHLVRPIARLVRDGGDWSSPFLYYAAENSRDPRTAASLYLTLAQLGSPPSPEHLSLLMGRLVQAGRFDPAARLYQLADPQWRVEDVNAQLDGAFSRSRDAPPFGWALNPNVAWLGAAPDTENRALLIGGAVAAGEWAARRLLLLPPGSYRIHGRYGVTEGAPAGNIAIGLTCVDVGETERSVAIPLRSGVGSFQQPIDVPAGCRGQWLSVGLRAEGDAPPGGIWIDDLRLTRAG